MLHMIGRTIGNGAITGVMAGYHKFRVRSQGKVFLLPHHPQSLSLMRPKCLH